MPETIVAVVVAVVLQILPASKVDKGEEPSVRQARVERVVRAAVAAAQTRYALSLLLADADAETHMASHVVEGHCERMPDDDCDHGRARGVWQVHPWCRTAYAFPAGSDESMAEEARCAMRQMWHGMHRCREHAATPFHGAFAALAARPCSWSGAEKRVRLAFRIDAALERAGVPEPAAER